ncbi:hypothetical protein TNCV_4928821 [Trichonephila clavipes]|nr:hypothetical protein TNCV_4928821 [Trichonephila clavipes]
MFEIFVHCKRLTDCACVAVSISKSLDGNFLIDFTEPTEPYTALEIRKEDQFGGASPRFSNQQWPWESPPLCNAGPPSRHHLELQGRRDYTPADRAARTCWLGYPGLLYYLAA